jgi:hypothetical protein
METVPKFTCATEQLMYYVKRFALFCGEVLRSGDDKKPEFDEDKLIKVLDTIPAAFFIGYVLEVKEKFGAKLDEEDLNSVGKLVALASPSKTPEGMVRDVQNFMARLEANPAWKKKFFSYWKVIKTIVDSVK